MLSDMSERYPITRNAGFIANILNFVDSLPEGRIATINGAAQINGDAFTVCAQLISSDATGSEVREERRVNWVLDWKSECTCYTQSLVDPLLNVHIQFLPRAIVIFENYEGKYRIEASSLDVSVREICRLFGISSDQSQLINLLQNLEGVRFTIHVQRLGQVAPPATPERVVETPKPVAVEKEVVPQPSGLRNDNHKAELETALADVVQQSQEIMDYIRNRPDQLDVGNIPSSEPYPEIPPMTTHTLDEMKTILAQNSLKNNADVAVEDPVFNQSRDESDSVEFENIESDELEHKAP